MNWHKMEVFTTTEGIDPVCAALMELGVTGFEVRDAADFEAFLAGGQGRWDYIDDSLLPLRGQESAVVFYLADDGQGAERVGAVRSALARLQELDAQKAWGRLALTCGTVEEERWAESWKRYYKPVRIGRRLVVCPTWEEYAPGADEIVLRLDPGMAFGSGTHESTRLCLELLEDVVRGGERVLDLGCGSGILGIAALLLGAASVVGADIEEVAVRVAEENASLNGVGAAAAYHRGNLARGVGGTFGIVCANIVADVILAFLPDLGRVLGEGGSFIASGIIDARAEEVVAALEAAGYAVREKRERGGWAALLAARKP